MNIAINSFMAIIPEKIINNGYKSLGLLSAEYYHRETGKFIAGFYEKSDTIFLIVSANATSFFIFNISRAEVDGMMKDEITLLGFLSSKLYFDSIPSISLKTFSYIYLLARLFFMKITNKVQAFPNKYYRWNAYLSQQSNNN